jgi:hypothetical protein
VRRGPPGPQRLPGHLPRLPPARQAGAEGTAAPFLILFLDGVGLAPPGPRNPVAAHAGLAAILGRPLDSRLHVATPALVARRIDATLGVDGLPQSATGQTTLFTGVNTARLLGRHLPAYPSPRLRELIATRSVFRRLAERGHRVAAANPYSDELLAAVATGRLRLSAVSLAILAAPGLHRSGLAELARGEAVFWDVRGEAARAIGLEAPDLDAGAASRALLALARRHDVTVYQSFLPDHAGHGRVADPRGAIARTLDLLAATLADRPAALTVVSVSDHGNAEDLAARGHTRNSVPLIAAGASAPGFARVRSLTGFTAALLAAAGGDHQ